MSGTETSSDTEQIFDTVSDLVDFYLQTDLDLIARDKIHNDLNYLENLRQYRSSDQNIKLIRGLISQIIPHFYVARGFAATDVPRNLEYYHNMEKARDLWEQIRGVIRTRSSSSRGR